MSGPAVVHSLCSQLLMLFLLFKTPSHTRSSTNYTFLPQGSYPDSSTLPRSRSKPGITENIRSHRSDNNFRLVCLHIATWLPHGMYVHLLSLVLNLQGPLYHHRGTPLRSHVPRLSISSNDPLGKVPTIRHTEEISFIPHHSIDNMTALYFWLTTVRPQRTHSIIAITRHNMRLLLLLSGQIELNPGPYTPKYPCQICSLAVKWGQRGLACDNCDLWYHVSCMSMSSGEYSILANKSMVWNCVKCASSNHTTVFSSLSASDASSSHHANSSHDTHNPPSPNNTSLPIGDPIASSSPKNQAKPKPKPVKVTSLRAIVVNFQSIKNKAPEVQVLVDNTDPDIIIGTETWLHAGVHSSEVIPRNYSTYRNDRTSDSHGGVLIAVKDNLICTPVFSSTTSELVCVKIETSKNKSLLISSLYRAPNKTDILDNKQTIEEITTLRSNNPNSQFWIGGDLNLPDINWPSQTVEGCQYPKEMSRQYLDLTSSCSLEQIVNTPTRGNNILDVFMTSHPSLISKCKTMPGIGDHDVIIIDSKTSAHRQKPPRRTIHLWNKANLPALHEEASSFASTFLTRQFSNINEMWDDFQDNVSSIQARNVPNKQSRNNYTNPWMNTDLRRLIRRRDRAYHKAKSTKSKRDFDRFHSLKSEARRKIRKANNKYVSEVISPDSTQNPKRFWSFVKGKRQEASGVAPLKHKDGLLHSDPQAKSEILNNQFTSVFTREDTTSIPTMKSNQFPSMSSISVSVAGVMKLLKGLQPHKATGPDSIPSRLLKELHVELAPALAHLFQTSIDSGKVPDAWKRAHIVPVYKKGDKSAAANYRPVSLTPICSKVIEHIIHSSVMDHLDKEKILSDTQHGFRRRRSCETQLTLTLHDFCKGLNDGRQIDMVLLDFSKAFDKVPHQRLLLKLHYYGVRGSLHRWIGDFLHHRKQRVIVDGSQSAEGDVISGVPQGTVIGPLLFLLYINDLPEAVRSKVRLFADDCIIYRQITSPKDSEILQEDLDALHSWECEWQMAFNPSKCVSMHLSRKKKISKHTYHLNHTPLEEVRSCKYLGITISNNLSWSDHVNLTSSKASRAVGFLRRNLRACPETVRARAYTTLVRPIIEYAGAVWDPYVQQHTDSLEKVQRQAARFAMNNYSNREPGCVRAMLSHLQWESLALRRARARATLMYKIVNNIVDVDFTKYLTMADSRTRGASTGSIRQLPVKLDVYQHSFLPRSIITWNNIPGDTRSLPTIGAFQASLTGEDLAGRPHH